MRNSFGFKPLKVSSDAANINLEHINLIDICVTRGPVLEAMLGGDLQVCL